MKKINFKELLVYVFSGFYIGFLISAVLDVTDICGGGSTVSAWGPRSFIGIATLLLVVFYFISKKIKKDLYFIALIVVFAIIFEGLIAQPLIKGTKVDFLTLVLALSVIHSAIFYFPRVLTRKIFKQKS